MLGRFPMKLLKVHLVVFLQVLMVRCNLVGLILRCKLVFLAMCTRVGVRFPVSSVSHHAKRALTVPQLAKQRQIGPD